MEHSIPQASDQVVIAGQTLTYEELRSRFGMPLNSIVQGCDAISIGQDSKMEQLRFYHFMACFPMHGFSGKAFVKLLQIPEIEQDPIQFFNDSVITESALHKAGFGPRQIELLLNQRQKWKVKGIDLFRLVKAQAINGCGTRIAKEWSKKIVGIPFSFDSMAGKVLAELELASVSIAYQIQFLSHHGYRINYPTAPKPVSVPSIAYVMTGSPKGFGFKTKSEFSQAVQSWQETSKLKDAQVLVTDDLASSSNKMKEAQKLGLQILTYQQAKQNYDDKR